MSSELTLDVIHRDDDTVVIDKPPGVLVHRSDRSRDRVFVLQTLAAQIDRTIYPVHRLDRATSGVLLFALSSESARAWQAALGEARKDYLALARGSTPSHFVCDRPLTDHDAVDRPRREAKTEFEKLLEVHRSTLLRATLHTGRRHQIRRHLHHAMHQVIGDTTYGKGNINRALRAEFALPRLFLHAERLRVVHPSTGEPLDLHVPLADDLRAFLLRLPGIDANAVARL
ncbi:MAG: pseudouridylate synthase [Planctomycetes bacterium]|nr:pseudouridylate synthase [Planctomycetota bacterium]